MKIFSAAQIKNGDLFTIKNEPIASVHLMEKAAMSCTDFIHHKYLKTQIFLFFVAMEIMEEMVSQWPDCFIKKVLM